MDYQERHHLHEEVPPAYYEQGIRTNLGQRWWHQGRLRILQGVLARLARPRDVLDLGCHSGWLSSHLRSWTGATVTGVDFSERAIQYGREHHPEIRFQVADISQPLPFADASFGLVTAFDVLEHLPDVPAVLREIRRVLRPGGTLLVTIPSGKLFAAIWAFWTRAKGAVWQDLHTPGFSDAVLRQALEQAGFSAFRQERHFFRMYHVLVATKG